MRTGRCVDPDLVSAVNANGVPSDQIPAKIEGLAFGQDIDIHGMLEHTLFLSNDNDFVADVAGPNQFFVFAFADSDLAGFVQQQFVPKPPSLAILSVALLGLSLLRRFRSESVIA